VLQKSILPYLSVILKGEHHTFSPCGIRIPEHKLEKIYDDFENMKRRSSGAEDTKSSMISLMPLKKNI